ncbi:MAG: extracellular solute-binding protein [Anaerolineales bacterium]|nr:extracellular solute-binding protein [Anaerolineales bacterium]
MPLGIEFAAAQVGRLPLSLIADQVETRLDTLQDTLHESTGRQRSLRASFDASWRTLTPGEQRVLAALSAVRGEFTLDAAQEIADATIADILRLTDKSLLRLNRADHYSLHEVIRHFGEQRLVEIAGGQEVTLQRYRAYYLRLAEGGAAAILNRAAAEVDPIQHAHNLVQHLRIIWRHVVDQAAAEATAIAMALSEAEWALGTLKLRTAIDTFELLEGVHTKAPSSMAQQQDAVVCDVIWLPEIQDDIQDISPFFGAEQSELVPILAETCSIEGHLVALPYVLDLGLLYYRRDLLEKYGFAHPPRTWEELARVAAEIQHQERAAGRPDFWGFVWEGHVSERIVCNALEWQHADGGGVIIEPHGVVSINNLRAQNALERAHSWIGAISPLDMHTFDEPKVVQTWVARNAAFMRIWAMPIRMWADPVPIVADSWVVDVTGVTLMPCGAVRHAATLGGWPLAIRRDSRDTGAAIKLIKMLASPEAQRQRALLSDPYLPTRYALYNDPTISATYPLLNEVRFLIQHGGFAVRPAKVAGPLYPQVSRAYSKAVAKILYDGADAAETLAALEQQLVALGGWPVQRRCDEVVGTPRILPN